MRQLLVYWQCLWVLCKAMEAVSVVARSSCTRVKKDEGSPLLAVVRQAASSGAIQILLQARPVGKKIPVSTAKSRAKPTIINVAARRFNLISPKETNLDYLDFLAKILTGYRFKEPCLTPAEVEGQLLIFIGDHVGGLDVKPVPGFEWISINEVLSRQVDLDINLRRIKPSWNTIFGILRLDASFPDDSSESSEVLYNSREDLSGSTSSLRSSRDSAPDYTVVLTRLGPNGMPEVLLEKSPTSKRLAFPETSTVKPSSISALFGVGLEPTAAILKKKVPGHHKKIVVCRADWAEDGKIQTESPKVDRHLVWKAILPAFDTTQSGDMRRASSTERLDTFTNEVLHGLDGSYGGHNGWRRIFRAMHTDKETPAQQEYGYRPIRHSFHAHLHFHHQSEHGLHYHEHSHECGKQYLVAVWNGTKAYLQNQGKEKNKSKHKFQQFDKFDSMEILEEGSPHKLPFKLESTSDLLSIATALVSAGSQRILVCMMLNVKDKEGLLLSGLSNLSSELLRRTDVYQALRKFDPVTPNVESAWHLPHFQVIREPQSSSYDFGEDHFLFGALGLALLLPIDHAAGNPRATKEKGRKHGKLSSTTMSSLIRRITNALMLAIVEDYEDVIFSLGRHEWEGIDLKCLLKALRVAMGVVRKLKDLGKLKQVILAIETVYDHHDQLIMLEKLEKSTMVI